MEFSRLYTVEDVAKMTGLTTRTIRNYLKDGRLRGLKVGAQWRFTEQNIKDLFEEQGVSDSMKEAKNQLVADFLHEKRAETPRICTIFDIPCSSGQEAQTLCEPVLELVNVLQDKGKIEFSFQYLNGRARFIIMGNPKLVQRVLVLLA